jgi:hypothetical protein
MTDKKWDDRKIEDLLGEIPDVKDNRSKSDILVRLKQDERLQKTQRKPYAKWIPAFVAVAALLLLSVLVTPLLQNEEKSDMSLSADKNMSVETESAKVRTMDGDTSSTESESMNDDPSMASFSNETASGLHYAVYPSDVSGFTLWHLGLAGDAAESVPVSFLIPDAQIKEDFGDSEPTSLELYSKYAEQLDETALGFQEYHPYKGNIKVDGKSIVHQLPSGHGYDEGSASLELYIHSLQDTFYGFEEIRVENDDGTALEFDQVGKPSKPLSLTSGKSHHNYYLFEQNNSMQFLTSNFGESYETLEVAIEDMRNNPNDIYTSVIPEGISYELIQKDDFSIINFTKQLDLDSLEPVRAMQLVEGLLLTGASFGEQLKFENVKQAEWNGFDFSKPLPIPVGANLQPLLLK